MSYVAKSMPLNRLLRSETNIAVSVEEEDQSYARGSLGTKSDKMEGRHKILGVQWDFTKGMESFALFTSRAFSVLLQWHSRSS